jgi:hypothetical protein
LITALGAENSYLYRLRYRVKAFALTVSPVQSLHFSGLPFARVEVDGIGDTISNVTRYGANIRTSRMMLLVNNIAGSLFARRAMLYVSSISW